MMVLLLNPSESIQKEKRMVNIKAGGQMEIRNIFFILKKIKVLEHISNGIQMESYLH